MDSEFTHEFFEAASKAWKANKVRYGQASYQYKKNAFFNDPVMPEPPRQSAASRRETMKELKLRRAIDEEAPPRVRTSPRLREKQIQTLYATQ